jgi:hyperosmotically inducible periplasmic protein
MRLTVPVISFCFAFLLAACDRPEAPPPPQTTAPEATADPQAAPDKAPTAQDQPATKADIKIVQEIRQAVVKDEALSTRARNITIVSEDGDVTLRGTVEDQVEKELLAARAQQVAGVRKVDNQLVATR